MCSMCINTSIFGTSCKITLIDYDQQGGHCKTDCHCKTRWSDPTSAQACLTAPTRPRPKPDLGPNPTQGMSPVAPRLGPARWQDGGTINTAYLKVDGRFSSIYSIHQRKRERENYVRLERHHHKDSEAFSPRFNYVFVIINYQTNKNHDS